MGRLERHRLGVPWRPMAGRLPGHRLGVARGLTPGWTHKAP
ncbi:MAG: hypothetical protein AVDCRST_MAG19-571 [uncultured Thermomicrobiales bacterium]|uniref:Uncharacterized protein n=1 Tax=uncultured Thermomicrobiales bacterium TaxID=1645740 RepID=A0A6J4UG29_9BACT|nr:MAG: hypothetical protein AVDCRST_MAG19-571 [uncultured Thermomicrobiales bacterium]